MTIYGDGNLSVGRLLKKTDTVNDGSHRFSLKKSREQSEKVVSFVIWNSEKDFNNFKKAMYLEEDVFLSAFNKINEQELTVKGYNSHGSPRFLKFKKNENSIIVELFNETDLLASATSKFDTFVKGIKLLISSETLL